MTARTRAALPSFQEPLRPPCSVRMLPVVTFGEIMMRLSTPGHARFSQVNQFEVTFGGAEANAAVMIAQLGGDAHFVTRLPNNPLGDRAVRELAARSVRTDHIVRGGDRLGLYFVEQGASQRPSQVLYDRTQSAIADAQENDFDWKRILAKAAWFHWSGITPALSNHLPGIVANACAAARANACKISFDMNFRAKLWNAAAAGKILAPMVRDLDLCVCGVEEACSVFHLNGESPSDIARQLRDQFGARCVAIPHREAATAGRTLWSAALFVDGSEYRSRSYELEIVDRIGAGDAFTGALLFAVLRGSAPQEIIDFAAAAAALKHTIPGDFALVTLSEVEATAAGGEGGRVQR